MGETMSSHCLLLLMGMIVPLPSICLGNSSAYNEGVSSLKTAGRTNDWQVGSNVEIIKTQRNATSLHHKANAETTNLRSWKGHAMHRRHHLRNAHGIVNIIGWGTLLPVGAIIARSFRKFPLKCDEWYNLHILCLTLGYIVGTIGWSIGMWLGNSSSKQHSLKSHKILAIVIFTLATIQMFALCLQPKRKHEYRIWWEICHKVTGYALIGMIIANIFQGIQNQRHAEKWRWIYVGILAVLAFTALALEIFRFVKPRLIRRQHVTFDNNIINTSI